MASQMTLRRRRVKCRKFGAGRPEAATRLFRCSYKKEPPEGGPAEQPSGAPHPAGNRAPASCRPAVGGEA